MPIKYQLLPDFRMKINEMVKFTISSPLYALHMKASDSCKIQVLNMEKIVFHLDDLKYDESNCSNTLSNLLSCRQCRIQRKYVRIDTDF